MGIKGLTSLLMEMGLWSNSLDKGTRNTKSSSEPHRTASDNDTTTTTMANDDNTILLHDKELHFNDVHDSNKIAIEPGSIFFIDGPSFAFYCHRLAYEKYYQDTIESFPNHNMRDSSFLNRSMESIQTDEHGLNVHDDLNEISHLVHLLLPTSMPYTYLHDVAQNVLQAFISCDIQCIVFYEDGKYHPVVVSAESYASYIATIEKFKATTMTHRNQQRQEAQDTLTSFLTRHVLPASFASFQSHNSKIKLPLPHVFLQEFPISPLLHSQVRHTVRWFAHTHPYHVSIRRCLGECDRAIAMLSYKDNNSRFFNKTFVLSHDSDYMLFGPLSKDDTVQELQYIPLDTLDIHESSDVIKGTILTRSKVAQALHITEHALLEASIVMGNDYTSSYMEQKDAQSTINFFREFRKESHHGVIHGKNKQDIIDGMAYLMEQNPTYQVMSDDSNIQQCTDFSRAWFTFQDIHDDVCHDPQDIEDENNLLLDITASNVYDGLSSNRENIQRQIIQTFVQRSKDEQDDSVAASIVSQLNWMELYSQPSNVLCTTNIHYQHHVQASRFQECIRKVLQSCSEDSYNQHAICDWNGDVIHESSRSCIDQLVPVSMGPSDVFHPIQFYNYMASKDVTVPNDATVLEVSAEIHMTPSNDLPIDHHRSTILSSIMNNRITIIEGETGSGKSSKVPIMIMEEPPPDPIMKEVKMFICQPRRIAAKSLAERVRSITTDPLKSKFALRMGHGHKEYETQESRAFFVTTGYMVRYLANNMQSFHNVTHLIIDEVHERSIDSDILCLLAKRLLDMHPHLRLVLMSATVASEKYREYFASEADPIFVGRRCFPIREMFLEDIGRELLFGSKEQQHINFIEEQSLQMKCLKSPNSQYMSILHRLSVLLATSVARSGSSVLIFVPGMADIVAITEMFEEIVTATNYMVLSVHSDIPFDDQMKVFGCRKNGEVRVIVATNAAESSITLPDVDHVFDFGLHKSITYNAKSHRQRLEASWISKASAIQRMGRTGRVRPGTVYRLYPKKIFTDYMTMFDDGEIVRVPLDATILNLRTILHGPISSILNQCIESPDITNIQNSFSSLFERRFISQPNDEFQLTPIGTLVAELGIDLNLGAMISLGILFGLIPETIELAAVLSCPQTPWLIPNSLLQEVDVYNDIVKRSYTSKHMFDGGSYSDAFAIMNLLWDYDHTPSSKNHQFAKEYAVSLPRLNRILSSRKNLQLRVSSHLNVPMISLCTKQPPRKMNSSTLTALRLIKTWIFNDSLITLCPTETSIDNGKFSLKLQGNPVEKSQFQSILGNNGFILDSIGEIKYKGRHEATYIDYTPLIVDEKSFESRLLSLSIEKNAKVLCHRAGHWIHLYAITTDVIEKIHSIFPSNDDDIYSTDNIECCRNLTSHKGWRGRSCGAWKVLGSKEMSVEAETIGEENKRNISCKRYCLSSVLHAKRKYKVLASSVLSLRRLFDIVCIEADPSRTEGPIEILHHSRTHNIDFEASELKDLFSTSHVRLQKVHKNHTQEIIFETNTECNSSHSGSWFQETQAPWEARLLTALACSQRTSRKPFVSLPNHFDRDDDDNGSPISTITFDVENLRGKWKWMETNGNAVVDSMSIPATITPQNHAVYACCGNILELKGDAILAENLTILPPGDNFLTVAFTCFGMSPPMASSTGTDNDCLDYCRNGMEELDFSEVNMECAICLSELRQPQITICRHLFCKKCIISLIHSSSAVPRCPYCRCKIKSNDIKGVVAKGMKERLKNANHFYHRLQTLMTSNEKKKSLCYSEELVHLLCDIFHGLDGLEVLPWDDSMNMEVVENAEPMTKHEQSGSTVDILLNEMGQNNLPSSFVYQLLDGETEETKMRNGTISSYGNRMETDNDTATVISSAACNYLQTMILQSSEMNAINEQNNEHSTNSDIESTDSPPRQRGVDLMAAVMSSRCYSST